jgi:ribulose-phosphate 3-epimerase
MNKKIRVSASILSANFSNLRNEIESVEKAGVDELHLDIMDGHFAPNITFGPFIIKAIKKITDLPLAAHLMITYPAKYIEEFINAGCTSIGFHLESKGDPIYIINTLRENKVKSGLVINPNSSIEDVKPYLDKVDFILVMTVYPGFAAQKFIPDVLSKIRKIRNLAPSLDISVDGGINNKTVDSVIEAGASTVVSASYIFSSKNRKLAIQRLRGKTD